MADDKKTTQQLVEEYGSARANLYLTELDGERLQRVADALGATDYVDSVGPILDAIDALRARAERAEECNEAMRAPMRVLREFAGMWAQSEQAVVAAVVAKAQRAASERDAARASLSRATERGERMREALRVIAAQSKHAAGCRMTFAPVAECTCWKTDPPEIAQDALNDDARDAAGGGVPRG